jgi:MFS family permease
MQSGGDGNNPVPEGGAPQGAARFKVQTPIESVKRAAAIHRRGSGSLVNLSLYALGISGLWTALGTPLLPIKVEEIVGNGGSSILGIVFDEDNKNGALGIVSLTGLAIGALMQPLSGVLSDRRHGPTRRLPYLVIGAFGMAASVLFLGLAGTLISLMILNIVIHGFGNFAQGSANGLISDHVSPGGKGAAAGALTLSRVIGAGTFAGIVLLLMTHYDAETAPGWMMAALVVVAVAAIAGALWTVTSLRHGPRNSPGDETAPETLPSPSRPEAVVSHTEVVCPEVSAPESGPGSVDSSALPQNGSQDGPKDGYFRFLVALTAVITGFSALQLYSFFYLEDVIGLDNAARGGVIVLLTTAIATGLTVVPAGRLTDRVGRDPMLYIGGVLGVLSTVILIFAESMIVVALNGLIMGVVIGIFLTVSWALANDLVSRRNAARELGYTSVAVLIGSAASRIAGLGVDRLNQAQDALGYQAVLGAVAICFIIAVALMTRLDGSAVGHTSDALRDGAVAD